MSECIKNCKLCNRFVISQAVTFADGVLTVNLPAGNYGNGCKYCIVIAQAIPDDVTIISTVVFTIGDDTTTTYPFVNCDCTPIYASQIRTRRLYPTRVNTAIGTGVFKYIGNCKLPCPAGTVATSLPVPTTTPVTPGA